MYKIGPSEAPLCVHCYRQAAEINFLDFLLNSALANRALDDMDMVSGITSFGGRVPVEALAQALGKNKTLNNITITNSQIGVINTGAIGKIDAAITLTRGSELDGIGEQLQALTQAIVNSTELEASKREESLEILQGTAQEIVGQQKRPIINSLMRSLKDYVAAVPALTRLADALWTSIEKTLG